MVEEAAAPMGVAGAEPGGAAEAERPPAAPPVVLPPAAPEVVVVNAALAALHQAMAAVSVGLLLPQQHARLPLDVYWAQRLRHAQDHFLQMLQESEHTAMEGVGWGPTWQSRTSRWIAQRRNPDKRQVVFQIRQRHRLVDQRGDAPETLDRFHFFFQWAPPDWPHIPASVNFGVHFSVNENVFYFYGGTHEPELNFQRDLPSGLELLRTHFRTWFSEIRWPQNLIGGPCDLQMPGSLRPRTFGRVEVPPGEADPQPPPQLSPLLQQRPSPREVPVDLLPGDADLASLPPELGPPPPVVVSPSGLMQE